MNKVELKIREFGPIRKGYEDDGFMPIPKVTLFCGPQGSGKSTIAKVLSTMMWLEKAAHFIGWKSSAEQSIENGEKFMRAMLRWHGLDTYFKSTTEIGFRGSYLNLCYSQKRLSLSTVSDDVGCYAKPKIMYMPAERNFLHLLDASTASKVLPGPLRALLDEFNSAKETVREQGAYDIPVNGYKYIYNEGSKKYLIQNAHDTVSLAETPVESSSSGLQSVLPLLLVTEYLQATLSKRKNLDTRSMVLSANPFIEHKEIGDCYLLGLDRLWDVEQILRNSSTSPSHLVNIVEEPEQNLFPPTQRNVLRRLLEINNRTNEHRLVISTHSPYLVEDILASIRAKTIENKLVDGAIGTRIVEHLNKCYPVSSRIAGNQVALYETSYNGTITRGVEDSGLISDRNFLNRHLMLGSMLLDELSNLEDALNRGSDADSRAD